MQLIVNIAEYALSGDKVEPIIKFNALRVKYLSNTFNLINLISMTFQQAQLII